MQNAKDSFYIALRDRLAVLNPERIMTLRGVERPSILMEEAENPMTQIPNDVFVLRWTNVTYDNQLPLIMVRLTCEVTYASSGSIANSGLDRGRAVSEMDKELLAITTPTNTPKMDYSQTPAKQLETILFWTQPSLGALDAVRDRLLRTSQLTVFAFEEAEEQ